MRKTGKQVQFSKLSTVCQGVKTVPKSNIFLLPVPFLCYTFFDAEKDLSTQKIKKKKKARFQDQKKNEKRPPGFKKKTPTRPEKSFFVSMLPSAFRLKKKGDFGAVKKQGKKFSGETFGLLVLPTGQKFSRFGFLLSNRLSKKATLRNRTKRRLREAVRKLLFWVKPGFDVVFLGRKRLLEESSAQINPEMEKVFKKAGLWRNEN